MAFKLIIDVALGFRQDWRKITGQELLWRSLRQFEDASVLVLPPSGWNSSVESDAGLIHRNLERDGRILCVAYSWGGGWRFPKLARALGTYGRTVDHAILCDPVYRSKYLPTWLPLNPMSLLFWKKIRVPPNVRFVTWYYQRANKPSGHQPVATDDGTIVEEGIELDSTRHETIDDDPRYRDAVQERVREWIMQIPKPVPRTMATLTQEE